MIPKLVKLFNYWSHYKLFDPKFVQQLISNLGKFLGELQHDELIAPYDQTQGKGISHSQSSSTTEEAVKNFNVSLLFLFVSTNCFFIHMMTTIEF